MFVSTSKPFSSRTLMCLLSAAILVTPCYGINPSLRIKNPTEYTNLVDGSQQTFSGDMVGMVARKRNEADTAWIVKYPKVRLEFWFLGAPPLLITSTETAMSFPVDYPDPLAGKGAWSGQLTIDSTGGYVFPYTLYAIPLNPFNNEITGLEDTRDYAVVTP